MQVRNQLRIPEDNVTIYDSFFKMPLATGILVLKSNPTQSGGSWQVTPT
jgi:hypothetical protein